MTYSVTGSPLEPFADAVLARMQADDRLTAIAAATQIVTVPPSKARLPYPNITADHRALTDDAGIAMQSDGGKACVWLDLWSDKNSAHEVHEMLGHVRRLFARDVQLVVPGFTMTGGSLEVTGEDVFADFDEDMPQKSLYHGVVMISAEYTVAD